MIKDPTLFLSISPPFAGGVVLKYSRLIAEILLQRRNLISLMLISTLLTMTVLQPSTVEARLLRFPNIHGDKVVFTYASDLWICDIKDGKAQRLTSHPGVESRARFSPDGKSIAFTGQYDGTPSVYIMPVEGGEPKRLTYSSTGDAVIGWTRDGKVAYKSTSESAFGQATLFTVDPKGGLPVASSLKEISDGSFSPDGQTVALNRNNSHQYNWRMYRGGTQGRIGLFNLNTGDYSELPSQRENSYFPMWVGDQIFFISDRANNNINLFSYDTKSKRTEQMTRLTDGDIRWPSTDGRSIVWERNGQVQIYNIATKAIEAFTPRVTSDQVPMRARYRGYSVGNFGISPSGKRLVVEGRGDIFSLPASNGETRNLTNTPGARETQPAWSPKGDLIAFVSDASGEARIRVIPQMGGEQREFKTPADHVIAGIEWSNTGKYISYQTLDGKLVIIDAASGATTQVVQNMQPANYAWAPDDSWIAYTGVTENLFSALYMYNVSEKKSTQVVDALYDTGPVAFDTTGKYLYFVSARSVGVNMDVFQGGGLFQTDVQRVYFVTLDKNLPNPLTPPEDEEPGQQAGQQGGQQQPQAPAPTKVDLDGFSDRILPLPWGPGSYPFVIGQANGVLTYSGGTLVKYDFVTKQSVPIIQGATGFSFTPGNAKMAYRAGNTIGIVDVRPGLQAGMGAVNTNDVAGIWDPRAEYTQMFWEVWRYQRDNFYDPNMLGVDWDAVGQKYAKMLPYVGDRSDLNYIFGMMIGELGTGHAYVSGGESNPVSGAPVGMLGADYEVADGKVRFKKVYKGFNFTESTQAPLGGPGVDVASGDYLIAIDGKTVDADNPVGAHLLNKVNKIVRLTVSRSASGAASRTYTVRPVGSENSIRYETWVAERRALVSEWSGGKIGYMHVPDTNVNGIINFVKGFYSQSGKEAWVIDERFNGGGWIPTFFTEALARQYDTALKARYGPIVGFPTQSLSGPKAMLINEYAGSGGDMFPWLFKNSKLGPLIGTRTWGGLVGIQGGINLVDGGNVTSPAFGIFDVQRRKWIAENTGVDPDVHVDNDPGVLAKGDDAQLKKAVEYLMAEIKAGRGAKPIVSPDFPKFGGGK